jgi:DNA gyrase subunit B
VRARSRPSADGSERSIMSNDDDAPASPAADSYDCLPIRVLEGVEPIRMRPGMYIGNVHDGSGLHQLVRELVDEALAHHRQGRCHRVSVTVRRSGAVTVEHDGPGDEISVLEMRATSLRRDRVVNSLHCDNALGCVNALSEDCFVEVHRGGAAYGQQYQRGRSVTPVMSFGAAGDTGLRVTFRPDPLIFDSVTFDRRRLDAMLRALAFTHPHLRIELVDERPGGARETFFGAGIADWVDRLTEGRDGFPVQPIVLRGATRDFVLHAALRWTRGPSTYVRFLVNDRDVEPDGFLGGLVLGLRLAARRVGLAAPSREKSTDRVRRGLVAIGDLNDPGYDFGTGRSYDPDMQHAFHQLVGNAFSEELRCHSLLLRELGAVGPV